MPAIVLLDINMPGLNGFEVLRSIRSRSEFEKLPVIVMLSGSENSRDAETALSLGANRFCTKPYDINAYTAFFDSLL
jgi:CheY-like chemotaxis protein